MRRFLRSCAALICIASLLFACAPSSDAQPTPQDDGRIRVVTTIFPIYDWTTTLLGDNPADVETVLLLDNGVDLHSFQPTAEDILNIATCDLFLYVGGESDEWVDDALRESANPDRIAISLLDALGDAAKEEETVEGMQAEEDDEEDADETEYDEHIWLSLKNADVLCGVIADALQEKDEAHAQTYADNLAVYRKELAALDLAYQAVVDNAQIKTLLFCDRFPFRYLTDDYGLQYYAAFAGCSAETEASFETVSFLSEKADELGLSGVLVIDGSDRRIAETVLNNSARADREIYALNSMQSTTLADAAQGTTYLSIMEQNLVTLQEALQ